MKTSYLWAVTALVLLAGCQKFGGVGSAIKFTASTRQDVAETKTAYSGQIYTVGTPPTTTTYERIDWVAGDIIRIASDVARTEGDDDYAEYTLGTPAASGVNSTAKATANSGAGLEWGTGTHHFWGI